MTFDSFTIVFTGLGGHGLISLLQILGTALVDKGYQVITSETHGLSQRGGKVVCFLRFGSRTHAPIPLIGTADMIVATEKSCVLDVLKYTKPDKKTKLIISTYESKIIGQEYPTEEYILKILNENSESIYFVPAIKIAKESIKNLRTANLVILGAILRFIPLNNKDLENSLKQKFSGKILEINLKALKEGLKYSESKG